MSKAVLMSIKPYYCEMIFRGEKTIEIRKRAPKLKPPFKVYVYCTNYPGITLMDGGRPLNSFVIGEFVCWKISPIYFEVSDPAQLKPLPVPGTGLTDVAIMYYLGNGVPGYGLQISRPRLYLKPKELSRFIRPCPKDLICEECESYFEIEERCCAAALQITRPPQSWCYVEEWYFNE